MEGFESFILRKGKGESLPMVIPVGTLKEVGCFLSCTCLISKSEKAAQVRKINPLVLERKVMLTVNQS